MDAHQFLAVAEALVTSVRDDPTQPNVRAVCRTAVGRAYYALFLLAREFVGDLGFRVRSVPNTHVTLAEALQNSGVFSLERIGETLDELRGLRTEADYEMRNTAVETLKTAEDAFGRSRIAVLQLDLIRAGRISPPLDRGAVANAILRWARDNGKPLWEQM